jgi:hypothetical protein
MVESGSTTAFTLMSSLGAPRRLQRIPAIVSFLNPKPALSLGVGNRASCPFPDPHDHPRERGGWGGNRPFASLRVDGEVASKGSKGVLANLATCALESEVADPTHSGGDDG